ncbi:MAG TPA: penicillin-binding transpeptidase domain-containing protein, partial [Solirubrobacterales bacterium]|nr:penicillin-binding transpeptidase domain-containing protein [Solirubrobacterales bacterium]
MSGQSSEVQRRRRLLTRAVPLGMVAIVAFVVGAATGAPGSPEKDAADNFAEAWQHKNYAAMYAELNDATRQSISVKDFAADYREAQHVATIRGVLAESAKDSESVEGQTVVPVPLRIKTVAFGKVEEELLLPWAEGGIAWAPYLVFPGLKPGEKLEAQTELAPRAAILAADGTPLAEGPADEREHPMGSAAIDVTGEVGEASEEEEPRLARQGFPPETPVGISGLEKAFNRRLAGKPGGRLLAVPAKEAASKGASGSGRVLAESAPQAGASLRTTIDPALQETAVAALAGRAGGVAVLDAKTGDVRALAGQAFSAPQPPGSTFKIITTVAALEKGVVSLDDEFEINDGINVGGRFIENANGEYCGGTFRQAFAESCNSDFLPLGPKIGNQEMVETAEKFGFNSPPTLYSPAIAKEVEPAESTIPTEIGEEVDLAVSAIGQGEVLATPLQMASVAQTIANDGVRMPTSIVKGKKLRPTMKPVRVMKKKTADELTELMVGVVNEGTGTAGAIAAGQVAGKTGTAELGQIVESEEGEDPIEAVEGEEATPEHKKDAWFSAYATVEKPKLAIGVLLIEAEAAGGEVAAPVASEVLS